MDPRVADYIFAFLADRGVRDVFMVTGGGAMYLDDGIRCQDRIQPVCCHHEQAAVELSGVDRVDDRIEVGAVDLGAPEHPLLVRA